MAEGQGGQGVDFSQLERVAAGDRGLILEVLGLFEGQAPVWAAELDASADADAWRRAAHSLKGSALAIGAGALAVACDAAEVAAGADLKARAPLGERVRAALGDTLSQIEAYRGSLG